MQEEQPMKGVLTIIVRDPAGRVLKEQSVHNLITNVGHSLVAQFFSGKLNTRPSLYIVVGGGDTKETVADVALSSPADEAAVKTIDVQGNVVTVSAQVGRLPDGAQQRELKEAGILVKVEGQSAPYLYNRATFPVVTQTSSTDITLSWKVTF